MATPLKTPEQPQGDSAPGGQKPDPSEASFGEQLIREARAGHAEFVAGWREFMDQLGIHGQPIGAKKLREMLRQEGIHPEDNEFSRGIIAMREE